MKIYKIDDFVQITYENGGLIIAFTFYCIIHQLISKLFDNKSKIFSMFPTTFSSIK